jgi:hypothetical protein
VHAEKLINLLQRGAIMTYRFNTLVAIFAAAVLSACGGGGGGGDGAATPVTSTETFRLFAIYVNTFTASSNRFTVSGTINGTPVTGSGTVTFGGLSNGSFEGGPAQQRVTAQNVTLTGGGQTTSISDVSESWFDSNYAPLGFSGSDDYIVVTEARAFPETAKVNDTGIWYTATRYGNITKQDQLGTRTVSYVMEADTATTAFLRIISTDKDISGSTLSTSSSKFRITTAGELTRVALEAASVRSNLRYTYIN